MTFGMLDNYARTLRCRSPTMKWCTAKLILDRMPAMP